jgi:hypothetical protein
MDNEQIIQLLDKLGERLTPTASHVYEIAVRQAIIGGICYIALAGVLLALLVFTIKAARRTTGNHYDDDIIKFLAGIGIIFFSIAALFSLGTGITHLLNPEYAALSDLLILLRP